MLKVENLRFGYVPTVDIFRNVNFTIHEGEFIAVGGKNGCGKTTITRLLVGLEKAAEGHIRYNGKDITSMPPSKRGQFIGYVFQQPDRQMFRPTVATEVAFGPESLGRSKDEVTHIVDEVSVICATSIHLHCVVVKSNALPLHLHWLCNPKSSSSMNLQVVKMVRKQKNC
mgnify:CR=1 FL=1